MNDRSKEADFDEDFFYLAPFVVSVLIWVYLAWTRFFGDFMSGEPISDIEWLVLTCIAAVLWVYGFIALGFQLYSCGTGRHTRSPRGGRDGR